MKLRTGLDMFGNEIKLAVAERVASLPDTNLFAGRTVLVITPGTSPDPDTGKYYYYDGEKWILLDASSGGFNCFHGTTTQWENMTEAQRDAYDYVDFTDETDAFTVVDIVEEDNMNGVTSNAVYEAIESIELDVSDNVTDGDMNPVTSNAVYDAIADIEQFKLFRNTQQAWNSLTNVQKDKYDYVCLTDVNTEVEVTVV